LAATDALLLDFDGPVCSIFADLPARYVADQLREVLIRRSGTELPAEVDRTSDPFDVLSYAATLGAEEARHVEAALRAHEVEAATTAPPTAGAHELIREWHVTGRKLAIVSNNSRTAVNSYLRQHTLTSHVHIVSARTQYDPELLKPNSHLVDRAITQLAVRPHKSTLVGDSTTDITAGRAAKIRTIGYANKAGKVANLSSHGADAVTTSIITLYLAIGGVDGGRP
jgi:HAD superfamily hydrolase (TIGR01549 family)